MLAPPNAYVPVRSTCRAPAHAASASGSASPLSRLGALPGRASGTCHRGRWRTALAVTNSNWSDLTVGLTRGRQLGYAKLRRRQRTAADRSQRRRRGRRPWASSAASHKLRPPASRRCPAPDRSPRPRAWSAMGCSWGCPRLCSRRSGAAARSSRSGAPRPARHACCTPGAGHPSGHHPSGRRLFAQRGYARTSVADIARRRRRGRPDDLLELRPPSATSCSRSTTRSMRRPTSPRWAHRHRAATIRARSSASASASPASFTNAAATSSARCSPPPRSSPTTPPQRRAASDATARARPAPRSGSARSECCTTAWPRRGGSADRGAHVAAHLHPAHPTGTAGASTTVSAGSPRR